MKKKLVRDKISNTPFLEQSILQTPLFLWQKSEPPPPFGRIERT